MCDKDEVLPTPIVHVRHCDPHSTGEGLGSHARRTLYPLLQVALHFGWNVIWEYDQQPCWKENEYRSYYRDECSELGSWLGFGSTLFSDLDRDRTIMVPLHLDGGDPRFGNLRGSPEIIVFVLEEYIRQHGMDALVGRHDGNRRDPVLITLFGRFEVRDDPTPPVLRWMHRRCGAWKEARRKQRQGQARMQTLPHLRITTETNGTAQGHGSTTSPGGGGGDDTNSLNIVVHIRVPEDFCSQEWKDANSMTHVLAALKSTLREWNNACSADASKPVALLELDVFTEESFSSSSEEELKGTLAEMGIPLEGDDSTPPPPPSSSSSSPEAAAVGAFRGVRFRIHRQTPLLPCVESMAVADVFVPASSYLSSMAAFFHTSLVVLPDEPTRHDPYFATQLKYRRRYSNAHLEGDDENSNDSDDSDAASDAASESSGANSRGLCPIVRVEQEEELKAAIRELWRSKTGNDSSTIPL